MNKRYDYAGILGFVVGSSEDDKDRWFCSEMVAKLVGLNNAWRFSPNALIAR